MLSIGAFSKICRVSTKTLRYYAEIGLLQPDTINPENGYRYYSVEQLERMLFIDRLKSYDFSLEEITSVLESESNQSEEKLETVFRRKKTELQRKADSLTQTLKQMESDILNLEKGVSIMSYFQDIGLQLVEVPVMYILSIRKTVTVDECARGYGQFYTRIYKRIAAEKLTMAGPPMAIYHSTEYNPAGYDIEFAIPVKEYITGTRNFVPRLCLKTVLKGSYSELVSIYARQREWAEKERCEIAGAPYDAYVTDPEKVLKPEDLVTEIYCPVRKTGEHTD